MTRVVPPALAALAGASAWVSLGQLAVLDTSTVRVAAMPPLWWLAVLVVAAIGTAIVTQAVAAQGLAAGAFAAALAAVRAGRDSGRRF